MCQKLVKIWRSIAFPGGSELTRAPKEPLKGAKITVMDILVFNSILVFNTEILIKPKKNIHTHFPTRRCDSMISQVF